MLVNIFFTLEENSECNFTTIKQVYNTRYTYKRSLRDSRTEIQHLMMLLECDNYIHESRCQDKSEVVSDLFWTHPDSVKLLNAFNIVFFLWIPHTKPTKYQLSLLEIVGVTSTRLTFSAGFAILSNERQSSFTWALKRLRGLFMTSKA